ncbi:MAG: choice-of-anchor D domain-containing protein [Bacteroidetes bacterium]|nr:choice-of-anchor D domain-containing protein [Bacteroidota bacterium]MCZ2133071.1 choice-of-anchor D domain-containing protein [Bacteroidota bacterium]
MKKFHTFLFVCALIVFAFRAFQVSAQDLKADRILKKIPSIEFLLNNSAQGRDYWFGIPMNDDVAQPMLGIELYITSSYDTEVTVEVPLQGFKQTKKVKAEKITTFTTKDGSAQAGWEIATSEIIENKGIHVYSKHPISVYVMNAKEVTTDGFLALPTSVWGREYMHCAYYDFGEVRQWGAGFMIVASEDKTEVSIQLSGRNYNGQGKTVGGRKNKGVAPFKVTLDRGQVYCVRGNGLTIGNFDLSGSRVTSSKPIGFLSYHMRCIIPTEAQNGRDYLVEMMPPIQAWGKKYVTIEFDRKNKGDYFRIIAANPNTKFNMKYYDFKTGDLLGQRSGVIAKNDFVDFFNTWGGVGVVEGIRGMSVWEADGPILLLQYAYSANWDAGDFFDPYMIVITPVEQYLKATVFQTPTNGAFLNNYLGLIVEGDSTDGDRKKLKSVVMDGDSLYRKYPSYLNQRIPGTNLYWVRPDMGPGAHQVKSETRFGGYIYGYGAFNSYGWPAAMALKKLDERDTLPPVLTRKDKCGDYDYTATELRNFGPPPDTAQIDQGIAEIWLVDSLSYNYDLEYVTAPEIIPDPKVTKFEFKLKVQDKTKDAKAIFIVLDRAGNFTIDSVEYIADKLVFEPNPIDVGTSRVNRAKPFTVTLRNKSAIPIKVADINLLFNKEFKIVSGGAPPEFEIPGNGTHDLQLEYTPIRESKDLTDKDNDSLIIKTECARFAVQLLGRGIRPCIDVEPTWDAGAVTIGDTLCKEQTGGGLRITNKGTDTLTVTNILGVRAPFSVSVPTQPAFPFKIAPRAFVLLNSVCFAPTALQADSITVSLESDSEGNDCNPNSLWKGSGRSPGPEITSWDWKKRRVRTIKQATLEISNSGTSDITLVGVQLSDASNPNFRILGTRPSNISASNPIIIRPNSNKVIVDVEYEPVNEAVHHNTVVPVFIENTPKIEGNLDGIGILPKINPSGWIFVDTTVVGIQNPDDGYVVVRNPSTSADLRVYSLNVNTTVGNRADFTFPDNAAGFPQDFVIPINDSARFRVKFTPQAIGRRFITVDMTSDAAPGPDEEPHVDNSVDVVGFGKTVGVPGIEANIPPYDAILTCNTQTRKLHVENTGDFPLDVTGLNFTGADATAFKFVNPPNMPFTIQSKRFAEFDVEFSPKDERNYSAKLEIENAVNPSLSVNLTGAGYKVAAHFELTPKSQNSEPGKTVSIQITGAMKKGQAWADAGVNNFTATLAFDSKYFVFQNAVPDGLPAGWTITPSETGTGKAHILTLLAQGSTPVQSDGQLINVSLKVMLSDTSVYPIGLDVQVPSRSACLSTDGKPAEVTYTTCFSNGRLVHSSGIPYGLMSVTPNPADGGAVTVEYAVGLTGHTSFELYNTTGEKVAVPFSGVLEEGIYRAVIPIDELGAGVYSLRMTSGQFSDSRTIVIRK